MRVSAIFFFAIPEPAKSVSKVKGKNCNSKTLKNRTNIVTYHASKFKVFENQLHINFTLSLISIHLDD